MKSPKPFHRMLLLAAAAGMILTACLPADRRTPSPAVEEDASSPPTASKTNPPVQPVQQTATSLPASQSDPASIPAPALDPAATHLPPEQWQEWPVVPDIPAWLQTVYQKGQTLGNDPQAFSKVGDCQSIKQVLMGIYDQPGRYSLREEDLYLEESIAHFAGSFNRDGMAVKGGFNAASVLSPLWADPDACLAGETPLECEVRVHKPSFVIISLEVWWEGRSVERYKNYMRQIIEFSLEHGVIPILSTKADNVEGDHSINLATAQLAYEYDLPLWNFWLAAQALPHRGIDPEREDNFHISKEAWTERSYTALKTLDAVWRAVTISARQAPPEPVDSAETLTAAAPADDWQLDETALNAALNTASERLILDALQYEEGGYTSMGVFLYDMENASLTRLLPDGFELQDSSPDGLHLLANQGTRLYHIDIERGSIDLLTETLYPYGGRGALWLNNGETLALIAIHDGQHSLWTLNTTDESWTPLTNADTQPVQLYPVDVPNSVFWAAGQCSEDRNCTIDHHYQTQLDSAALQKLSAENTPYFTPDAGCFAWKQTQTGAADRLVIASLDNSKPASVPLPGNEKWNYYLADADWSPDGDRLVFQVIERSNYSGRQYNVNNYLLTPESMTLQKLQPFEGLSPRIRWSPDGGRLIMIGSLPAEDSYQLHAALMTLPSQKITLLDEHLQLQSDEAIIVSNLFWLAAGE